MRMSTNEIHSLKRYFEIKSLHVSDYWLQCCLDWFKGEYKTYTENFMCKSVYEQWLDSDLRDIEVRCLPNNINQQKKTILNGKYALQVMYIKDISKPAYSQLKTMRDLYKQTGSHVDNEPTETSGKRVLHLFMTDGVQEISGFEYQTVPCLNLYLSPGIKILLIGPVIVRNGEFMFKESNVKVLGGEVEDLKIVNAPENVLARELNMPENLKPRSSDVTNNNTINSTQRSTQVTNNTSNVTNRTENKNSNSRTNESNTPQFEDDYLLMNFDTSAFEQQEAAFEAKTNQQNDMDLDDDLFKNLSFSEAQNTSANIQNFTNTVNNTELSSIDSQTIEEIERQEFEKRLQEEEDLNFNFDDDIDIVKQVIEENNKPKNKSIPKIDDDIDIVRQVIEENNKPKIKSIPKIENPFPFVYIKYLQDNRDKLLPDKTYRVKASFTNNVEKIKLNKINGWTMKFEIKDSSSKMIVDFLSEVIQELTGLNPAEALAENRGVRNKETKSHEKLAEALAKCKEKLEFPEYMMDLKFSSDDSIPTIVNLETVNVNHLEQIKHRVQSIPIKFL